MQLGKVCALALACWGLPLVLIGAWPSPAVALAALFATGVSNAVLDISGFTLIQRGVRNEDRMLIFGVFEGLLGIGLLLGSLLAPALIAVVGVRGAFVVAGAILPDPRSRDLAVDRRRARGDRLAPRGTSHSCAATRSSHRSR